MAGLTGIAYSRTGLEPAMVQGTNPDPVGVPKAGSLSGQSPAYSLDLSKKTSKTSAEIQQMKRSGKIECQTCKTRTYQDGSNDPGVSFKAPGHISPESSASVVMAHEQEHVGNEQANAKKEGSRVVSQSVRLFTAVCPECGRVYVSGGETRTTTASSSQPKSNEATLGKIVDLSA